MLFGGLLSPEIVQGQEEETWPREFIALADYILSRNIDPYENSLSKYKDRISALSGTEKLEAILYVLHLDSRRTQEYHEEFIELFRKELSATPGTRYDFFLELFDLVPNDVVDHEALTETAIKLEEILRTRPLDPGQKIYGHIMLADIYEVLDRDYRGIEIIDRVASIVSDVGSQYTVERLAFFETQYLSYTSLQQGSDAALPIRRFIEVASEKDLPIPSDSMLFNAAWVLMVQGYYKEAKAINKVHQEIAGRSKFAAARFVPNLLCLRISIAQNTYQLGIPCIEEAEKHIDEWAILAGGFKIEAARTFANLGNPQRARLYLQSITEDELKYVSPTIKRTIQEVEAIIQYAEGNYQTAFETYREFNRDIVKRYDDLNNRTTREISDLSLKETKALRDLNTALESEALIQQESIERVEFYLNIVILVAIFAVLLIGLLGYQVNLKQKLFGRLETANSALSESLKERELLLKEIHHRIKNNLQLITSLLNLQGRRIHDDGASGNAKRVIREINGRVHTMSLIHKELYRSQDYDSLDVAKLIQDLTAYVISLFGESTELDMDLDSFVLNLNQAMPMGLITCEVLTNCLEHGRSDETESKVIISLKQVGDAINLKIADNGPGFDTEPNFNQTKSLGLLLIRDLTQQIGGEFSLYNCPEAGGVCFDFTVPINHK